jgi:iron complex outermembrane receptor protein
MISTAKSSASLFLFFRTWAVWTALSVIVAGLAGERAWAQEPDNKLTQLSLAQLGSLEVASVSKVPEEIRRTPAAVFVLTQEDIRRSGATSIPEVLRLVPGVEVARIDSVKWAIGVRGFGSRLSRSLLVLIDGRKVYTPLFAGVYWEVQDTLLEDIDRIEVIRGPGGTVWGSNAVNGVINIITKSAEATRGMLASVGGGNLDQGFANFRYGSGNGGNFSYRFYGKAFTRGPQFHADNRNFDDWRMGQGGFRTDWNLHDHDTLTIQGDLYTGVTGNSLGVSNYTPPSISIIDQNAEVSGGNVMARWQRVLPSGTGFQLQAYYDRTDREDINFSEVRNTGDVDFVYNRQWGRQKLIGGLGARFSASDTSQVVSTVAFLPGYFLEKNYSAFAQTEIAVLTDRLWLTVGSKFLNKTASGFEYQPSVRVLWAITPSQSLWSSVARAVRTPSRVEEHLRFTALFLPTLPAYIRLIGDGGFTPEELLGYELGYRISVGSTLLVDAAAFYNDYDDLLSVEANIPFVEIDPPSFRVILPVLERNGIAGSTTGAEVAPTWAPTNTWRVKGSYSFLRINMASKIGSIDGSTARSLEGSSPRHRVVAQSLLDLPAGLNLDVTYRYVSALPALAVKAYSTGDVRFGWNAGRFELSVAGQNLFQPHHSEFAGNPGPLVGVKRSVYGKLTWTHEPR